MQKPSLFQEGERAIQKIIDILKHLEDVIFPKMHVLLEFDSKMSDTHFYISDINYIFLNYFIFPQHFNGKFILKKLLRSLTKKKSSRKISLI